MSELSLRVKPRTKVQSRVLKYFLLRNCSYFQIFIIELYSKYTVQHKFPWKDVKEIGAVCFREKVAGVKGKFFSLDLNDCGF